MDTNKGEGTFYMIQHHTIMSGLVVRWRTKDNSFGISASREGVFLHGNLRITGGRFSGEVQGLISRAHNVAESIRLGLGFQSSLENEPPCVDEIRKAHFGGDDEVIESRTR